MKYGIKAKTDTLKAEHLEEMSFYVKYIIYIFCEFKHVLLPTNKTMLSIIK